MKLGSSKTRGDKISYVSDGYLFVVIGGGLYVVEVVHGVGHVRSGSGIENPVGGKMVGLFKIAILF